MQDNPFDSLGLSHCGQGREYFRFSILVVGPVVVGRSG
jgi:hypothetical protein